MNVICILLSINGSIVPHRELRRIVKKAVKPLKCAKSFPRSCDVDKDQLVARQEWTDCLSRDGMDGRPTYNNNNNKALAQSPFAHRDSQRFRPILSLERLNASQAPSCAYFVLNLNSFFACVLVAERRRARRPRGGGGRGGGRRGGGGRSVHHPQITPARR